MYAPPIKGLTYQTLSKPINKNKPKKNTELMLQIEIDPDFIAIKY